MLPSVYSRRNQKDGPRKERNQDDGYVKPDRLVVLKFGGEEAFEVVLDKEDAKKLRIATGTENIPGKGR